MALEWFNQFPQPQFKPSLQAYQNKFDQFIPLPFTLNFKYSGSLTSSVKFRQLLQHQGKPGYPFPQVVSPAPLTTSWQRNFDTPKFAALPSYQYKFDQFIPLPIQTTYYGSGGVIASSVKFTQTLQHQAKPGFPYQIFIPTVAVSGAVWFAQSENPPPTRFSFEQIKGESYFTLNTPFTINIPWHTPYEPPRFSAVPTTAKYDSSLLIPSTLPPQVSGIAWHTPYEPPRFRQVASTSNYAVYAFSSAFLPTTLGIPWNAGFQLPRFEAHPQRLEQFNSKFLLAMGSTPISGMAWFNQFDRPSPIRFNFDDLKRVNFQQATIAGISTSWYLPFDFLPSRARISDTNILLPILPVTAPILIKFGWDAPLNTPFFVQTIVSDNNRTTGFIFPSAAAVSPAFIPSYFDQPRFINRQFVHDRTNIVFNPITQTFVAASFDQPQFKANSFILDRNSGLILRTIAPTPTPFLQNFDVTQFMARPLIVDGRILTQQLPAPPTPISGMAWFTTMDYPGIRKPSPWLYQDIVYLQAQLINLFGVVCEVNVNYPLPVTIALYPGFVKKYI